MNLNHSSAARWVKCNASPRMEAKGVEPLDQTSSDEGIKAHRVAALLLTMQAFSMNDYDDDMLAGAELYRNVINVALKGRYNLLRVEDKVQTDQDNRGIIDAWFIDENVLYLYEYKYGFKQVEAYLNWQLINNALALDADHQFDYIVFNVVQPRGWSHKGQVSTWEAKRSDVAPYFQILEEAMVRARADKPLAITGPYCYKCKAASTCAALREAAWSAVELAELGSEHELPDDVLGSELKLLEDHCDALTYRIDGLRTDLEHRIRSGARVAGYDIVPTTSALKWTLPTADIIMTAELMGVDIRKPADVLTPTQVKNKNLLDPSFIDAMSARTATGTKLVRDAGYKFRKIFS